MISSTSTPQTPNDVIFSVPDAKEFLRSINAVSIVDSIASLVCQCSKHAYLYRLDFALRIVFAYAHGESEPVLAKDLDYILNTVPLNSNMVLDEDPPETPYAERFISTEGDVVLLNGILGPTVSMAQTVYDAFAKLTREINSDALNYVNSLVRIARLIEQKHQLRHGSFDESSAHEIMPIGNLSSVSILNEELSQRHIEIKYLDPFFLNKKHLAKFKNSGFGNSPFVCRPLIANNQKTIVAAPHMLSTAIRSFIIQFVDKNKLQKELQLKMAEVEEHNLDNRGFETSTKKVKYEQVNGWLYRSELIKMCRDRWVHVIHTVEPIPGDTNLNYGRQNKLLNPVVDRVKQDIQRIRFEILPDSTMFSRCQGMTLWITGGWGPYTEIEPYARVFDDSWAMFLSSPSDLCALADAFDITIDDVWRLARQFTVLEKREVDIMNLSGLINLYRYWLSSSYTMSPLNISNADAIDNLTLNSNFCFKVRSDALKKRMFRTRKFINNDQVVTTNFKKNILFPYEVLQFCTIGNLSERLFYTGVDTLREAIWLKAEYIDEEKLNDHQKILAWNSVFQTLSFLIFHSTRKDSWSQPKKPVLVILTFIADLDNLNHKEQKKQVGLKVSVDIEIRKIVISFNRVWFESIVHKDHEADMDVAIAILIGLSTLSGYPLSEEEARIQVKQLFGFKDLKWTVTNSFKKATDLTFNNDSDKELLPIPATAFSMNRFEKSDQLGHEHEISAENKLLYLKDYYSHSLYELIVQLRFYDQPKTIVECLRLLHLALVEKRESEVNARVTTLLGGEALDTAQSYTETGYCNEIIRACLIIVELSLHEAGKCGAEDVKKMEMEELMALAVDIFRTGNLFLALKNGFDFGEIRYGLCGDLQISRNSEYIDSENIFFRQHRLKRKLDRKQSECALHTLDSDLTHAFIEEFGISLSESRICVHNLILFLLKIEKQTFIGKKNELIRIFSEGTEICKKRIEKFVKRLTLKSRAYFMSPLEGANARDCSLYKVDRVLSIESRPIMELSSLSEPTVIVSPVLMERTLDYHTTGAIEGKLQNEWWESESMKKFTGRSGSERGHLFNQEVGITALSAGMEVYVEKEISFILGIKKSNETKMLGDVDVIAIDRELAKVWVIEAKDLRFCRTLGEMAMRRREYLGLKQEAAKPDKMKKHLRRVDELRKNANKIQEKFKLHSFPTITGLIVFSSPQPVGVSNDEKGTDSESVTLEELKQHLSTNN